MKKYNKELELLEKKFTELTEEISKIRLYINESPKFLEESIKSKELLKNLLSAMNIYASALAERIEFLRLTEVYTK